MPALVEWHLLVPDCFWHEGDIIDGYRCAYCKRLFPTHQDARDIGRCDVDTNGYRSL